MKELLKQYRRTRRMLEQARNDLLVIPEGDRTIDDRSDLCNIESMMLDVGFIIRYLEQRKYPDPMHSVSRWQTEKREILMEPAVMSRMFGYTQSLENCGPLPDPEENETIAKFLSVLSPREKEVFLMIKETNIPWREAADILEIHPGRVNNIMGRVRKKFEKLLMDIEKPRE